MIRYVMYVSRIVSSSTRKDRMERTYEQLKARVKELQAQGKIDVWPSDEQRADWAYGNTKIENDGVTREMAEAAARARPSPR